MINYNYLLERGEKPAAPAMKQTDLHVRLKMKRNSQPLVSLGETIGQAA
jgi:hypothetical protein